MNKNLKNWCSSITGSEVCGWVGIIFLLVAYAFDSAFCAFISLVFILLSSATQGI